MRVLITTLHIHPVIPLAQALEAAGHQVALACSPADCPTVETIGLRCFPAGANMASLMPTLVPYLMQLPEERRDAWVIEHIFGATLPERIIPDLITICQDWQPELIVRDSTELGGCIAAEYLGLPHASVEVGVFLSTQSDDPLIQAVGRQLNQLRASYGLRRDPELAMLYRYLHLSFVPPCYQNPAMPLPSTAHALRTVSFDRSGDEALPGWVDDLPEQPTVYITLGLAVFNRTPGVFPTILAGLRDQPLNLILTIGRGNDPAEYGPQPANVHIEAYIPQTLLLPHCDLVIAHGGWNTILAALSHGLPLVVIPLGADQPQNAQRVAALDVGRVIEPSQLTPKSMREATQDVLQNPAYRRNAERVREEMESLPGPERAVELLEDLARDKKPLRSTQ
jgi:UDP:flavonoid glycosyltransferase YjiC (YdhE family)